MIVGTWTGDLRFSRLTSDKFPSRSCLESAVVPHNRITDSTLRRGTVMMPKTAQAQNVTMPTRSWLFVITGSLAVVVPWWLGLLWMFGALG